MSSGAEVNEIYSGSEITSKKERQKIIKVQPMRDEDSQTFDR